MQQQKEIFWNKFKETESRLNDLQKEFDVKINVEKIQVIFGSKLTHPGEWFDKIPYYGCSKIMFECRDTSEFYNKVISVLKS